MSFIFRDMLSPAKALQQHFSSIRQKFKSVWPLNSNDPTLYSETLIFYSNGSFRTDKKFTRFIKSLGLDVEEFTSQSVDSEIETMFFKITPGFKWDGSIRFTGEYSDSDWGSSLVTPTYEPTPSLVNPTSTEIVEGITDVFTEGDEITITIGYGGELKRYIEEHELSWVATGVEVIAGPLNTETIRNKILSDPWYYIINSRHLAYTKDSNQFQVYDSPGYDTPTAVYRPSNRTLPTCDTAIALKGYTVPPGGVKEPNLGLGIFALMAEDSDWEPILNDEGINLYNTNTSTTSTGRLEGEVIKYTFSMKFIFKGVNETSKYVKEMNDWYDSAYVNLQDIPTNIITSTIDTYKELRTTSILDTKSKIAMSILRLDPSNGTNSLYTDGYLIVDVADKMKSKDFAKLLGNNLETDYTVEEASFFEKLVAAIIVVAAVIVAVLLAVPSGGTSLTTLASGLAAASGILAVGMMGLSAFGGLSVAGLVKQIGAFATIIGYISMVVGISAAWRAASNAALTAAKQTAIATAQEASTSILTDITKDAIMEQVTISVMDVVKEMITSTFTNLISFGSEAGTTVLSSAKEGLNLAMKGFEVFKYIDQEKIQDELNALEDEYKVLSEELDNSRRLADPGLVLTEATESVSSYDAISMMDLDWRINKSPQGYFDSFEAERTIT